MHKLREWLGSHDRKDWYFTMSLLGLAVGFWMAWEPLGLIVPCSIMAVVSIIGEFRSRG